LSQRNTVISDLGVKIYDSWRREKRL